MTNETKKTLEQTLNDRWDRDCVEQGIFIQQFGEMVNSGKIDTELAEDISQVYQLYARGGCACAMGRFLTKVIQESPSDIRAFFEYVERNPSLIKEENRSTLKVYSGSIFKPENVLVYAYLSQEMDGELFERIFYSSLGISKDWEI